MEDKKHVTHDEWVSRLNALACEAGENGDDNLEVGFLLLARACKLPRRLRQGLANVSILHLSLFEQQAR